MTTTPGAAPEMIANNLAAAYPTHPGEVLKDEIEYRGISQKALAERIGMSYKMLNDLLNARRPLSTETAMKLEAALDIPADSLLRLQMKYNLQTARRDSRLAATLRQIRSIRETETPNINRYDDSRNRRAGRAGRGGVPAGAGL